jgi:hypothetical protein
MVLVPLVVALVGPSSKFLPFMPSCAAINLALLMNTLAFGSFSVAVEMFHKKQSLVLMERFGVTAHSWFPPVWIIVVYAILGISGVILRFGNVNNLIAYFIDPQSYLLGVQDNSGGSKTLAEAAPTFLLSFVPFTMILLWCRDSYTKRQRKGLIQHVLPPGLIAIAALSASLGGYSRAGFVIPMIAVAAVMAKRSMSGNWVRFVGLGVLVLVLVLIVSSYRLFVSAEGVKTAGLDLTDVSDLFQDYGTAPQYLGFLLQSTGYSENPELGRVVISSALSPVPILGKTFREHTGNSIYQKLLGREDQPDTFVGELFLDFSGFGVIVGFLGVGAIVAALQNRFEKCSEPFEVYILQLVSVCISYFVVCGIEEVSQHFILLFPVYFFLLYRFIKKKVSSRSDDKMKIERPGRFEAA